MKLNKKITILRKRRGLSQEELANELGVSRQTVYKWEAGINTPEMDKITALSKMFGVSYDILLNDELDLEKEKRMTFDEFLNEGKEEEDINQKIFKKFTYPALAFILLVAVVCTIILLTTCFHKKYEPKVYSMASCLEDGVMRYYCTGCDHYYDEIIPATGHNMSVFSSREPSCEVGGSKTEICLNFNCKLKIETTLESLGHSYITTSSTPSTCYEEGVVINECEREGCESRIVAPYKKKEHTLNSQGRCTVCGEGAKATVMYVGANKNGSLITALESAGHTIAYQYSTVSEITSYDGCDLFIFDGVVPTSMPQSGAVWLINASTAPDGSGIELGASVDCGAEGKAMLDGSGENSSDQGILVGGVLEKTVVSGESITTGNPMIGEYTKIEQAGNYETIIATEDGDALMLYGEMGELTVIVTAFDIKSTSLPIFALFPVLLTRMVQIGYFE